MEIVDPKAFIQLIGVFAFFFIAIILYLYSYSVYRRKSRRRGGFKRSIDKVLQNIGFTVSEIDFFKIILMDNNIEISEGIIHNQKKMENILAKEFQNLESIQEESLREKSKVILLSIRQKMDRYYIFHNKTISTNTLKSQDKVIVRLPKDKGKIHMVLESTDAMNITLILDEGEDGSGLQPGKKYTLYYYGLVPNEYSFRLKLFSIKDVGGKQLFSFKHGRSRISKNAGREHRRKAVHQPCTVLTRENERRNSLGEPVLLKGLLTDISSGGCSLILKHALADGEVIQIQYQYNDMPPVEIIGRVLRTQGCNEECLMNIKFLSASQKDANLLNEHVYGYDTIPHEEKNTESKEEEIAPSLQNP